MEISGNVLLQDKNGLQTVPLSIKSENFPGTKRHIPVMPFPLIAPVPFDGLDRIQSKIVNGGQVTSLGAHVFTANVSCGIFQDEQSGTIVGLLATPQSQFQYPGEFVNIPYGLSESGEAYMDIRTAPNYWNRGINVMLLNPALPYGTFLCTLNFSFRQMGVGYTQGFLDSLNQYVFDRNLKPMQEYLQSNPIMKSEPAAIFMACVHRKSTVQLAA
jgi:hypothetical protein